MVMAKIPLTPAERDRIHAVVTDTKQRTATEFALVIVPASSRYALFPVIWAATISLTATGALALLCPLLSIGHGFLFNAGLFIFLTLIFNWPPLRLWMVPASIKRNYAQQLAHREFASLVLSNLQHRNNLLFFVSFGEHYVEILADREIHNRVAPGTWEKITNDFVVAVRANHLADGFISAVGACGAALEEHP
jgi:putative membrane protein